MGPNDAELVRAYTKEVGGNIADVTFPYDQDIEIVVEAEAGPAIFDGGGQFELSVFARNLKANGGEGDPILVPLKDKNGTRDIAMIADSFGGAWKKQADSFKFVIPASSLGPEKKGAVLEIVACLQVGIKRPDVSFVRSALLMVHKP